MHGRIETVYESALYSATRAGGVDGVANTPEGASTVMALPQRARHTVGAVVVDNGWAVEHEVGRIVPRYPHFQAAT